jgi:hypothetical protein
MIETYAFLGVFTAQIVVMSVLYPGWISKSCRAEAATFPVARFEALYPNYDFKRTLERHLTWLRVMSIVTAVCGVALMVWLFGYMQRPDWDLRKHWFWVFCYGMAQLLCTVLIGARAFKFKKLAEPLREKKRIAVLQRRGLFDFVSPAAVTFAIVSYLLLVAYLSYLAQNPAPGYHPIISYTRIVTITFVYLFFGFFVYRALYRRKSDPVESNATREFVTGILVRTLVYVSIGFVAILAARTALTVLDLPRWRPSLTSLFFIVFPSLPYLVAKTSPRPSKTSDAISCDISQQPMK